LLASVTVTGSSSTQTPTPTPSATPLQGTKKYAVIMAYFSDQSQPNVAKTVIADAVAQVNTYWRTVSNGLLGFAGDVYGWYQLPIASTCELYTVASEAIKASNADVYYPNYDGIMVIPAPQNCPGLGELGDSERVTFTTKDGGVL